MVMWPFHLAVLLVLFPTLYANELSRCCAGGGRHYREEKACIGLKSEGSSPTCSRTAAICCLRASLEKSCQLGREMAVKYGYCSNTVNVLGGGLRKECCDCCLLAKELSMNGESCEAPVGFSAACLSSFNKCCSSDTEGSNSESSLTLKSLGDKCEPKTCDHICSDKGDNGVECSCKSGYDLGPDGRSCIGWFAFSPLVSASLPHSRFKRSLNPCYRRPMGPCHPEMERCVPLEGTNYRCDILPANIISSRIRQMEKTIDRRSCATGYQWSSGRCTDIDECLEYGDEMCLEPNTQCLNSAGSFQCVCKMGFYWSHAGQVCVDIDECLIGADCLESQRCLNTPGSYKCIRTLTCGTGYALDSETDQCVDVDECNLGSHDCGPLYHCRNTQGSYRCDAKTCGPSDIMNPKTGECISVNCPPGYEVVNGSCADIDECRTTRRCGFYEECINLPGSYRCQEKGNLCASGFRMDKESGFCLDIDECATGENTCSDLQCINLPGSFKCRCSAGFEFNENTKLCEDVDECEKFKGHICSQHATCENTIGAFICHCNKGYKLGEDGRHCDDVDECENGEAQCQQRCVNTPGSYQCVCNRGYQLGFDEKTCEDIDECSTWARSGQELCMGKCINTPGAFRCTCPSGYALLDDNVTCKDIDECASTGCSDPNSVCVNTLGGFRCQKIECPDKYVPDKHYKNRCVRDGSQCVDVTSDECRNSPVHISWQHIAIPKQVNISSQRTSITLFSMKGPSSSKANMQFELRIVDVIPESTTVNVAVRENFLLQKGDDRNSAIIALRDSLDGPQEVILELTLRLTNNGHFSGKYVANLVVYVSQYKHTPQLKHLHIKHHHHHHQHKSFIF
ncbi:unnamed protein product [Bursaphelenchus okinawaensis]|uniref:Fibulin-1 n=1 Tax=Bursaphelenchus okinawaensis TaxID=465554 RepID=A0A811KWQ5_9BILA|nr:unnamed protein product [Bursaphelenchus okinawaensis]CAG9113109.1 unnamed protein product [Bursaphelenchus okinawaensis]